MSNRTKKYFIGLDVGTGSVGWSVTNENYTVLNFNKKRMEGVRLFTSGETAEARRMHRTNRRRLRRRNERLQTLRDLFAPLINQVDADFFTRMDESFLHLEDRSLNTKNSLFDDKNYKDQDYHRQFPTIYHLRQALIDGEQSVDIRHIYLAVHHILKYRGHFLVSGDLNSESNLHELLERANDSFKTMFDSYLFDLDGENSDEIGAILKNETLNLTQRKNALKLYQIQVEDKELKKLISRWSDLLAGSITSIVNLFPELDEENKEKIQFSASNYEDVYVALSMLDEEQLRLIDYIKYIYDWGILETIRDGEKYLSQAMINQYNQHGEDLELLKCVVKQHGTTKEYNDLFRNRALKNNYVHYIGQSNEAKQADYDEFKRYLKKLLKKYPEQATQEITDKLDLDNFLIKLRTRSNGVIPRQIHQMELKQILNNAVKQYPELTKKDDDGLSIQDKIIQLFTFRIPYYVGPLNNAHQDKDGFSWVVRKEKGKIYPWNFKRKVDLEASAERFIRRMTNKCAYLPNEDVLPKHSLLYQRFELLNELNNLKINGEPITPDQKQGIYQDLFINQNRNIYKKHIAQWFKDNNLVDLEDEVTVTGIDSMVKSRLTTYHDMVKIFNTTSLDEEMIDIIINWITIFAEGTEMLPAKIKEVYGERLTAEQIKQLSHLTYSGWGRLSKAFLTEIRDARHFEGEFTSIIQALETTNYNLMELLSQQFDYMDMLDSKTAVQVTDGQISYDLVDELYVSPAVKRSIWQTLRVVDEVVSIQKNTPEKIFIEMARGAEGSGRTDSRKDRLKALYKNIKNDSAIKEMLDHEDNGTLRSKKLYLYYLQRGRCAYTGEEIVLKDLFNHNLYDIDHIYPRSLTKDDSFDNLVLVKANENRLKGDKYPLHYYKPTIYADMDSLWSSLKHQGLMSEQKYARLIRKEPLSDQELAGFINRQLVETRQSTKALSELLQQIYPETTIVYVKARQVSDFRQNHGVMIGEDKNKRPDQNVSDQLIKVRSLNDLHHAKDAYLNIVVGNVYHTKFTSNPYNFIRRDDRPRYNLARMFESDVERNGKVAWVAGANGTIKKVLKMMKRHDVLTTRMLEEGNRQLFNATIIKKEKKAEIPLKKGLDTKKYGGYHRASKSNVTIVKHKKGRKSPIVLCSIPMYLRNSIKTIQDLKTFVEEYYRLSEVEILVPCLYAQNELFEIDGVKVRITGTKNENYYYIMTETQPVFTERFTLLWKKMEPWINNKNICLKQRGLNDDLLEEMYRELRYKSHIPMHGLDKQCEKIESFEKKFAELSLEKKADMINKIVGLFRVESRKDIKELKINKDYVLNRNLSNQSEVILIRQSITGLFEERIDVLNL